MEEWMNKQVKDLRGEGPWSLKVTWKTYTHRHSEMWDI